VGPLKAPEGAQDSEQYQERRELARRLKDLEPELSSRYGFPVRFIFLDSRPEAERLAE